MLYTGTSIPKQDGQGPSAKIMRRRSWFPRKRETRGCFAHVISHNAQCACRQDINFENIPHVHDHDSARLKQLPRLSWLHRLLEINLNGEISLGASLNGESNVGEVINTRIVTANSSHSLVDAMQNHPHLHQARSSHARRKIIDNINVINMHPILMPQTRPATLFRPVLLHNWTP